MISWRIWIKDIRQRRLLPKEEVRKKLVPALQERGYRVDRGPSVVFHGKGDLPGEWSFSISDERGDNCEIVSTVLHEIFLRQGFQLRQPPQELSKPAGEATLTRMRAVRSSRV